MKRTGAIKRSQISPPLELLSTTNVLAFNAPNIYGPNSADESDSSMTFSNSTRATTPDSCSIESPGPIEPNHLSSYFQTANHSVSRAFKDLSNCDSPTVPQRALSHTKQSHQAAARKRSVEKTIMPPNSIHDAALTRSSIDMFSSKPAADHPFGAELTKVNELADEIGARDLIFDEEEQYLIEHGLCKFAAEDYLDEIEGLFGGSYNNPFSLQAVWI